MKKRVNNEKTHFTRSKLKTQVFYVVLVLLTLTVSLAIFIFTPLIRTLGIVGEGRLIASERVFENVISMDNNMSINELVFKYFMSEQQGEGIDYNRIIKALSQVDSLNNEVELWRAYAYNIRQIIDGTKKPIKADSIIELRRDSINATATRSALDTLLRNQMTTQLEKLVNDNTARTKHKIYPPMSGQITNHLNYKQKINGITISTNKYSPIMSVTDGTIISSGWTSEYGYTMQIQHPNNIISIYKGLTRPLKEVGDRVSPREVIGYIGINKEVSADTLINVLNPQSTTFNLYFELWHNGNLIDPEKYIIF